MIRVLIRLKTETYEENALKVERHARQNMPELYIYCAMREYAAGTAIRNPNKKLVYVVLRLPLRFGSHYVASGPRGMGMRCKLTSEMNSPTSK